MVQSIESAPSRTSGPGRIPPHNIEAEESLLGAMLLSRDAIVDAIEAKVAASDFYKPAYGHIFDAVVELYGQGEPVDPITLAEELRRKSLLDALGGKATLLQLQAATPSSANAGQYASIVAELALLRRLIAVAGEISEEAYSAPEDVGQTLDHAESLVFEVADRRVADSEVKIGDSLALTLDQLEQLYGREDTLTGVPTGYTDLDNLLLGLQPSNLIVVAARPGMGKCVAWDTPIVDPATGAMRTAAELYRTGALGAPVDVLALGDDWKLHRTAASAFVDDGIRPVHRVRLRSGREVRTTMAHPFLTARGWRPLAEVAKGDRVAVPRELPIFGRVELPEPDVALLAYLIGAGTVLSSPPRVTTRSSEVLTEMVTHAAALGVEVRAAAGDDEYHLVAPDGRSDSVVELLRRHDVWGTSARDKTVPAAVFRLPRAQLARFLSRLFAASGSTWIDDHGNGGVAFHAASERLSRAVQHLLLRFGVNARLLRTERPDGPRARRMFELQVTHSESIRRFCNEIGIFGDEAAVAHLRDVVTQQSTSPDHDTIPAELWSDALADRRARSWASVSGAAGRPRDPDRPAGSRSPSRETVAVLADKLGSEHLRHLAESDVWWDEVVEIEFDGNEQVYDLTVPAGHNFVAADVIVHNTAFALGAAANVAVVEQRPVLFFSMEMGHLELTKRLLAAEARVDLRRLQTGNIPDNEWSMISHAVGRLAAAPLFIDDNPHCTIMEMRAKARRTRAREGDLGLIVIDYLQLMSSPHRVESRQVEVSDFSRGLKILARELDTPVMALSQLNRQLEYRADKRPMLADLRETGCLTRDTLVTRADTGADVSLGELLDRGETDIPVWTLDEHLKLQRGVMKHVFPSGTKPVFELRLTSGRRVKASANHPFLAFDGWRRLDQLTPGTAVAVTRALPAATEPSPWTDSQIVLLGHLIGDGCHVKRHSVQYTTIDPENVDAVVNAARDAFGIEARVVDERTWTQVFLRATEHLTHGRRNPVAAWLDELGLWDRRSWEKFIPSAVTAFDARQLALFLRHLWATDGCVSQSRAGAVRVFYGTTSRELATGVQALLLRLDIRARLRATTPPLRGRQGYTVDISGRDDQLRFFEVVGIHGERGERIAAARNQLEAKRANPNVDTIPSEIWDYVRSKVMPEVGVSTRELASRLGMQYCGSALYKRGLGRERMQRLASALPDPYLRDLADSDVFWDRVEEIVPVGAEPVYDAEVPGTHNFLANGLVVHNSIEQDADVVMFVYRDEVYNPESEHQGMAEIIVAKHRNGPSGNERLAFFGSRTKFENMARE